MEQPAFLPFILVPVFNNAESVGAVVRSCLSYFPVLVINDGSSDTSAQEALDAGAEVISLPKNCGKGVALQRGFVWGQEHGYTHAIALDGDGQHLSSDIDLMVAKAKENPSHLIVGVRRFEENVPRASHVGRWFSNFWIKVASGVSVNDSQSGFRIYSLTYFANLTFVGRRYEFEVEVMVKLFREGAGLSEVPISVYYPPPEERVSHFKALPDTLRISCINTYLIFLRFVPKKLAKQSYALHCRVKELFSSALYNNSSPRELALSVLLGTIVGCTPFFGFQIMLTIFLVWLFRLNQAAALAAAHISIPPFIPFLVFLSIHIGSFCITGNWAELLLEDISLVQVGEIFYQYLLGGLILGSGVGLVLGSLTYAFALHRGKKEGFSI